MVIKEYLPLGAKALAALEIFIFIFFVLDNGLDNVRL